LDARISEEHHSEGPCEGRLDTPDAALLNFAAANSTCLLHEPNTRKLLPVMAADDAHEPLV
jgi:hypothetical protein